MCGEIERAIGEISLSQAGQPWSCFGNEAKAASVLLNGGAPPAPYERFLFRPSFEPVVLGAWGAFMESNLDARVPQYLVDALTGAQSLPRTGGVQSARGRDGQVSVYPEPGIASGWQDRVTSAWTNKWSPFSRAAFVYAEIALSHPYADGNGRLARAFMQGSFAKALSYSAPHIPLGPAIYANSKSFIPALIELGSTGKPESYLVRMAEVVALGLDLLKRVTPAGRPA